MAAVVLQYVVRENRIINDDLNYPKLLLIVKMELTGVWDVLSMCVVVKR